MSRRGSTTRSRSREDGWEGWGGYMNAKKQKLHHQYDEYAIDELKKEGSGSRIFTGVSIHVDGYTKPSSDELKHLLLLHGGCYEHYLYRTRVTHVIATNLPNSKVKQLKGLKVVRPEWITDSIAAGKLLSYTQYLLYTAQSGLQKGLQTYTTSRQNSNQSEGSLQSINSNTSDSISDSHSINITDIEPSTDLHLLGHDSISGRHMPSATSSDSVVAPNTRDIINHTSPNKENSTRTRPVNISLGRVDARDPKFLNEFYSNSRLHFLSTLKAEWKNYVNELQTKGGKFPGREILRRVVFERAVTPDMDDMVTRKKAKMRRCVMHIDMDCFFVSVGLRKRPDLRGKPVAVTHSKGRDVAPDPESDPDFERRQWELKRLEGGMKSRRLAKNTPLPDEDMSFPDKSDSDSDDVRDDVINVAKTSTESFHSMADIASCSYEARQVGVRNGMLMGRAKSICPELVTIPYDFDGYKTVSKILYDTVASFTHDIEAVSCDEMLVDCTDLLADTGATPLEFASLLRTQVYEKTGCTASAGLASCILLARMATRKAKPNGQFHLTEDCIVDYIKSQPVRDLPGVGSSLTKRLEVMKVTTCGELQQIALDTLQQEFGPKTGQSLHRYCRGVDDRPIKMEQQRKSVSAEVNYGIRFTSDSESATFMEELSEEVCSRLKSIKMKGKSVTLKLMVRRDDAPKHTSKFMGHGICKHFSKSVTLPMATDDPRIVAKETICLLRQYNAAVEDLRGIGIQIQKLEAGVIGSHGNKKHPSILGYTITRSSSVSGVNNRSSTVFVGDNRCSSVLGCDNRSSSVPGGDNRSSSVPGGNNRSSSVPGGNNRNSSVPGGDNRSSSVPGGDNRSSSVPEGDNRSSSVPEGDNKSSSVPEGDNRSSSMPEGVKTGTDNSRLADELSSMSESKSVRDASSTGSQVSYSSRKPVRDASLTGFQVSHSSRKPVRDASSTGSPQSHSFTTVPHNTSIHENNILNVKHDVTSDRSSLSGNIENVWTEVHEHTCVNNKAESSSGLKRNSAGNKTENYDRLKPDTAVDDIVSGGRLKPDVARDDIVIGGRLKPDVARDDIVIGGRLKLDVGDQDLLEDLGRRQTGVPLPPLPCLPDIKTPESTRKCSLYASPQVVTGDNSEKDYFPSPSQVDPDVLSELPPEIRQQIETELQKREKKKSNATHLSAPGCSRWQPDSASNSAVEEIQKEADRHSHDVIVPLPSPSQIDLSCLEALPESMQAELRQAYARQGSKTSESSSGTNTFHLKQAKSPNKSPNKRSPGKNSPGFKIPRGRPSGRGRKRGSSKKSLFKDQSRTLQQESILGRYSTDNRRPIVIPVTHLNSIATTAFEQIDTFIPDTEVDDATEVTPVDTVHVVCGDLDDDSNVSRMSVNLCGAVDLNDVRQLIKEWISSTPVPQTEDEAVIESYLLDLIRDRNLEQVDLVLKFMFRKIQYLKSSDWLRLLQRIFSHTQAGVYDMYGSRLASITF